ncbi:MAG: hypothetical protein OWS74_01190 [Firmicutes bacterium]|nr:hypothetical protein [Bacillota bacterium]
MNKKVLTIASGVAIVGIGVTLTGCGVTSSNTSTANGKTILTVATVNNSQMVQMEKLTKTVFEKKHPNIEVKFVTLPEKWDLLMHQSPLPLTVATGCGLGL